MADKIGISGVLKFLEEYDVNNECTLLSTEKDYQNAQSKLSFKCNGCGENFERSYHTLRSIKHYTCSSCSKKKKGKGLDLGSHTLEYVKDWIEEHDVNNRCTLLSTEYINNKTPLLFRCNLCGETFERPFCGLHKESQTFSCIKCSRKIGTQKNIEYTKDDLIEKMKEKGDNFTFLEEYTSMRNTVKCQCDKKHEPFNLNPWKYIHEETYRGCRECYKIRNRGENHPNWKGGDIISNVVRHSEIMNNWRVKNIILNNRICYVTGEEVGSDLEVHHLSENFKNILDEECNKLGIDPNKEQTLYTTEQIIELLGAVQKRHEEVQGVVLRKDIHQAFHKKYGYFNNTPKQLEEFKKDYLLDNKEKLLS